MPIVLLENPREGEWRGKIAPTNWADWWEDYENYLMHYAWLAESAEAEVFMVGSELVSTETDTDHWKDLIARVRKAYHGRLGYSANWDHYKQVGFWDVLDLVGMTTYHDLGDKDEPHRRRPGQAVGSRSRRRSSTGRSRSTGPSCSPRWAGPTR